MLLNLSELIRCYPDQIASRYLSNQLNVSSSITLFAFGKGESISNEKSTYVKLVIVLEGILTVDIEGSKNVEAKEGQLVQIPAQRLHNIKAIEDCKVLQIELPESKK